MRTAILFILVLFPCLVAIANGPLLPKIINFEKEDYQAHNQNWAVTQVPSGIMYFANNNGLLEFDGLAWYGHSLPEKQIARSVAGDADGKIYSGGYGEFGYWERDMLGQLRYVSISAGRLVSASLREEFWHIEVTKNAVYFQSFSSLFEWKNEQLRKLTPPGNIMFLSQIEDRLIVPVINGGLYELLDSGRFQPIPGGDIFRDKIVSCILPWKDHFLVGTEKAGLFVYDGVRFSPWQVEINSLLPGYQLNKGIRLSNGHYAFGTILEGLFVVDQNGRVRFHFNQENGLQNNTILSLHQDRTNNLWLGLDSGISLVPMGQPLLFYEDLKGVIGSVYTAAIFEKQLFIGTNRGLFFRPWPLRKEDEFQLVQGMQGQTWDLLQLDGQLLCGHNEGIFRIYGDNRIEKMSNVTGGWQFCEIPGRTDRLIVATYTGLVLLRKNKNTLQWQFDTRISGFAYPVRNLKKGPKKNSFWAVVPNEGVFQLGLNPALDSVLSYSHYTQEKGVAGKYQVDLQVLDTAVWVQTNDQALVFQPEEKVFKPIKNNGQNYFSPVGKLIWLDKKNFAISQDHFVWYIRDGMDSVKLPLQLIPDYELVKKLNDSLLLFGLDEGFALLNPGRVREETFPLTSYLKSLHFYGRKRDSVQVRFNDKGLLEAEAGTRDVRFEFSHLVFTHPVRLRHRLLPFQSEWSDWSSSPQKTFTNLPPGLYTMEIQSNTSTRVFSRSFRIQPLWYQTNWVLVPYLLVIGLLIFAMNRWQKKRMLKQQKAVLLEKEKQFHQEKIQMRNEQLRKDILNKSQELANSTFNLIRKNEILIAIKEELKKIKPATGSSEQKKRHQKVVQLIDRHLEHSHDWEVFEENFNEVHEVFLKKLISQYPELTPGDLKLAAYLRMNLSSKEIAPLLNISVRGVENKRYRLRKKLDLPPEENLTEFMINY
jgi:hypothetical protein